MGTTKRTFTPEFKREAVALLESSGRPQMQIAAELGIQPSMLRAWREPTGQPATYGRQWAYACGGFASDLTGRSGRRDRRLRRELDRTRMERDILKNVWPAPSARWSMKAPVTGLHKRIRHVGTVAAAKMESRTSRAS